MAFAEAKAPFLRSNFEKSKNQKIKKLKWDTRRDGKWKTAARNKAAALFAEQGFLCFLPSGFARAVRNCGSQVRFAPAVSFLHSAPAFSLLRKPWILSNKYCYERFIWRNYFFLFSHFWFATPQLVLQADWQDVWHSPQPPFCALLQRSRVSIVLILSMIG